ncbi:MAG TPA: ADOP family duplicated permease [Gemmatimonadaceae bacterium]|jgi:predicted permease
MLDALRLRLRALFRGSAMDAELDEELRYHLDAETERNITRGMSPKEAALAARRGFGNPTQLKEEARDSWGRSWLERLVADTRYALRSFRRAPGFAVTVVATIALGLGLNTTAFTIFDAYVLRPMAVRDPASLYQITWHDRGDRVRGFSWRDYEDIRNTREALSESFAIRSIFSRIDSLPAYGQLVSGNFFSMLGVGAALGRTLVASDAAEPGTQAVVVLSYDTWRSRFGADSSIIGKMVRVRGQAMEVVGVAARGFGGLGDTPLDFWAPATMNDVLFDGDGAFGPHQTEAFWLIGRLRPELTPSQGSAWMMSWLRAHHSDARGRDVPSDATVQSRATSIALTPEFVIFFTPIATAFVLVLLTACANVANMMLARGLARQRELGIRLSLGAARGRLVGQLLTEAVLLALPAALLGFAISRFTIDGGVRLMFATIPAELGPYMRIVPLAPDGRIFLFMLVAAVTAALLFGLAPALQATRPNIVQATRGDFDTDVRPSRLRNSLIVAQVTTCVLLLVCAGILFRGVGRMQQLEIGIQTHGVVRLDLQERPGVRTRVLQLLHDRADVRTLAAATDPPFGHRFPTVPGGAADGPVQPISYDFVTGSYFGLFGIPIIRGRTFTAQEERVGAAVVIVSDATARALWPGREPVGQVVRLTIDSTSGALAPFRTRREATVIGVAANVVLGTVIDPLDSPVAYYPSSAENADMPVLVRVTGPQGLTARRIDSALAKRVPGSVEDLHTIDDYMYGGIYPFRATYWIAGALGVIALLLTLTGVYGVLSYVVAQRRKELGIRIALGASAEKLVGLVLGQSMRLCAIGLVAGTVLALGVARLFEANIVRLDTYEPAAFAGGALLVMLCCLVASYIPSRRAGKADPMEALRSG